MATTSLANRSASVSSEPDATSDGYVGASLCWRYARISLVCCADHSTPNYCYSDWVVTKFEPHARREALRPMRYGAVKPIAWGC